MLYISMYLYIYNYIYNYIYVYIYMYISHKFYLECVGTYMLRI